MKIEKVAQCIYVFTSEKLGNIRFFIIDNNLKFAGTDIKRILGYSGVTELSKKIGNYPYVTEFTSLKIKAPLDDNSYTGGLKIYTLEGVNRALNYPKYSENEKDRDVFRDFYLPKIINFSNMDTSNSPIGTSWDLYSIETTKVKEDAIIKPSNETERIIFENQQELDLYVKKIVEKALQQSEVEKRLLQEKIDQYESKETLLALTCTMILKKGANKNSLENGLVIPNLGLSKKL